MLYILETNLPENKPVLFALVRVFGIGEKTASLICKKMGFSINFKVKNLTQEQASEMIQLTASLNLPLNNELRNFQSLVLKSLTSIKARRGIRRSQGLPVRGQRTHTNSKSARRNKRF